jgi:hypothetical protein
MDWFGIIIKAQNQDNRSNSNASFKLAFATLSSFLISKYKTLIINI